MTTYDTLASLHDATLETIEMRWDAGEVILRIRTGDTEQPRREIIASAVRRLAVPRELPWGPSVSINRVRGPTDLEGGVAFIDVEMQTGDVIRIEAKAFSFRRAD